MCFEARYALLDNPPKTVQAPPAPSQLRASFDYTDAFFADLQYHYKSSFMEEEQNEAEERKAYERDANILTDHTEFIRVLGSNIVKRPGLWPQRDKIPDQLRPDFAPHH